MGMMDGEGFVGMNTSQQDMALVQGTYGVTRGGRSPATKDSNPGDILILSVRRQAGNEE